MIFPETDRSSYIQTIDTEDTYNEVSAYNNNEDQEGDWDDEDDEVFDDMANDREDLHDVIVEGNLYNPEDDDHLPEEEAD